MDLPSDYFLNNSVLILEDTSTCDLAETLANNQLTKDVLTLLFGAIFYMFVVMQLYKCFKVPDSHLREKISQLNVEMRVTESELERLRKVNTELSINLYRTVAERDDLNNRLNGLLATLETSRKAAANLVNLIPPEHDTQG